MHTRDNDIHAEHKSIKTTGIKLSFIKKKEKKFHIYYLIYVLYNIFIQDVHFNVLNDFSAIFKDVIEEVYIYCYTLHIVCKLRFHILF